MKKLIREIMLSPRLSTASDHSDTNYARSRKRARLADESAASRCRGHSRRRALRSAALSISSAARLADAGDRGRDRRRAKTDGLLKEVTYRSAYLPIVRGMVPEFLSLFDVEADAELVTARRDVTTICSASALHDE